MEELMGDLDSMRMDMRNWQVQLREISWPSRSISLIANDLITWLGMAASVTETLAGLLAPLEETKPEVKEIIEEEESGEVPSEPVPEPEDREASDQVSTQEPEAEGSEGD